MVASRLNPQAANFVALDPNSLTEEGTGYRIRLTGLFDAVWIRAYLSSWTGSSFFSRFEVDLANGTVWFSLSEADTEEDVAVILTILEAMLRLTGRRIGASPEVEPRSSAPRNRLAPRIALESHLTSASLPSPNSLEAGCEEQIDDLSEDDIEA